MTKNRRDGACAEVRERFVLLLDDEGSVEERAVMLAHIESCEACAASWTAFRETAEAIRSVEAEPTDDERRAILSAAAPILEELRDARTGSPRPRRVRRLVRFAAVAAAAAILFFLVQNLSGPGAARLRSMDVVHYYETGETPLLFGGADCSVPR